MGKGATTNPSICFSSVEDPNLCFIRTIYAVEPYLNCLTMKLAIGSCQRQIEYNPKECLPELQAYN